MNARFEHHGPDHHSPIEHAFDRAYREREHGMNDEELIASAEAAWRELDAAGLTPDELRFVLVYLCGYAPDAVRAAVASMVRTRPAAPVPDEEENDEQ